ncbi:MAG TPA: phospho-N-acetylmuramoyl-pentapeptide-transferase [Bacillota bacterium]|nr:phospho-N-acetylmuramoyl-pentapeptide-transferase [Bacillota bacterium]
MDYLCYAGAFAAALAVSALLLKVFIPVLRKAKLGQKILEIGPNWHKCKEGTPTMGGVFFILGIIVAFLCFFFIGGGSFYGNGGRVMTVLLFAVANALIGFVDDYVKLFKKRNKGLSAPEKLILQLIVTAAFIGAMIYFGYIDTNMPIPFTHKSVDLGLFTYAMYLLIVVFYINGANFTDGIDGLAGSVNLVITVMFLLVSLAAGDRGEGVLTFAVCGALCGFLIFNFHPAKVFMGDTGSLFLGGLTAALAFAFNCQMLIFVFGFVHFFEAISVVLQVVSYKLTGKRIFKMAPIHHHFEKCGWTEVRIVAVFSFVTALLCGVSYWLIVTA